MAGFALGSFPTCATDRIRRFLTRLTSIPMNNTFTDPPPALPRVSQKIQKNPAMGPTAVFVRHETQHRKKHHGQPNT